MYTYSTHAHCKHKRTQAFPAVEYCKTMQTYVHACLQHECYTVCMHSIQPTTKYDGTGLPKSTAVPSVQLALSTLVPFQRRPSPFHTVQSPLHAVLYGIAAQRASKCCVNCISSALCTDARWAPAAMQFACALRRLTDLAKIR